MFVLWKFNHYPSLFNKKNDREKPTFPGGVEMIKYINLVDTEDPAYVSDLS